MITADQARARDLGLFRAIIIGGLLGALLWLVVLAVIVAVWR